MIRTDLENGDYKLASSDGYELIILDTEGNELARTKEVIIPIKGTLHEWVEVPEKPEVKQIESDQVKSKISELEQEIALLKSKL